MMMSNIGSGNGLVQKNKPQWYQTFILKQTPNLIVQEGHTRVENCISHNRIPKISFL